MRISETEKWTFYYWFQDNFWKIFRELAIVGFMTTTWFNAESQEIQQRTEQIEAETVLIKKRLEEINERAALQVGR